MDESAIPQNNRNLAAEKGPGCDVRHRFALSSVYRHSRLTGMRSGHALLTQNWHFSTIYQVQSGMPLTISVFGDTANSGTVLGENPIRANYTGQPVFGPGTHTAAKWFNPAAFATPAAFTFGNVGRNSVYGPPLQTLDVALVRAFRFGERTSFQFRGEAFNVLNKVESRYAQSICEHAAVRHHHHGYDTRPRDSVERKGFLLVSLQNGCPILARSLR